MRIAVLTKWLSRRGGGIPNAVVPLLEELARTGGNPRLYGFDPPHEKCKGLEAVVLRSPILPLFPFERGLGRSLESGDFDIVHTHGLWSSMSVAALRWRGRTGRPIIVSPHGMLDGWALTQSRLKKTAALSLFERRHLQLASCVHALTAAEAEAIRCVEPRAEVIVVPNGIRLPYGPSEETPEGPARRLLYLGRLHKKKGLEHLLKGWAEFRSASPGTASDWRLEIAGWGDRGYVAHLRQIGEQLDLGDSVEWSGPLFGAQREAAYRRAQAVILPSVSEGLPMVLLEAWSYRLPTFMTPQCNLPEGFAAGAGFRIEAGADAIASALAMSLPDTAGLRAAGEAGFRLVQQNYSWAEIAGRWRRIYEWTAGRGPRPAEVLVPSVLSAGPGLL